MIGFEKVDIRYVFKVLFLCIASVTLGNTFEFLWLGILFALFFIVVGVLNATSRREFAKRPRYNKIFAYGAIVPLALFWVMTPSVENGVSPYLIFLPGVYLLYLAALQERSRGNGGFEAFVAFDGVAALLLGMYMVPQGWGPVGIAGFLLALCAYSRRGTSPYKYLIFILVLAVLGGISYVSWHYWKSQRSRYTAEMAENYYQRERMMGFDPVVALGSFGSNFSSRYNDQVVLRVWTASPPAYLKAASYEKYVAGLWKLPASPVKKLLPAYYQVDYAVFEVADSLTRANERREVEQVWVQSTLDNFGFIFAPYGAVGFAAKDVDSLSYYAGGMVQGLDGNGKRSDWYYFRCGSDDCELPDSMRTPNENDLLLGARNIPLIDTVIEAMGLRDTAGDSLGGTLRGVEMLEKVRDYFREKFTYSLTIPGLRRRFGSNSGGDPLAVFWHTKQGYCEYYATLSVLMLRRLGIPARYATGFVRPEIRKGRPYAVFRRKNSHAWAEVFVDGRWMVFDPTPPLGIVIGDAPGWWNLKWEGVRGRFARIMHLLKEGGWRAVVDRFQESSRSIVESPVLYALLLILVLGFAFRRFYVVYNSRIKSRAYVSAKAKEWTKKLNAAERTLARLGYRREPGETVGAFAKRVEKAFAGQDALTLTAKKKQRAQQALRILDDYEATRWADREQ